MKEMELKFKVRGFDFIRRELKKLKARLIWKGKESNIFFDKDGFLEKKKSLLRLRNWPGHSVSLTFKGKNRGGKFKSVEEIEVQVPSFESTRMLLKALGYREVKRYSKIREHWYIKKPLAHIELDKLNNLYIAEIEARPKDIENLARRLNLDFSQTSTKSYFSIVETGF